MADPAPEAAHLVHGMGMTLEAPAWPAITAAEALAILARYPDAGQSIALRWHSPRPFSAATLVHASGGEFLLKRHHRSLRSPLALAEEHHFIAHLRAAGLSVPEILVAASGSSVVSDGEWTYELHRLSPGMDLYRDRNSWTPFLSHDHAHAAGVALARLHLAARGFAAAPRGPHALVATFSIPPAPDPMAAAEAYVADRPALATFLSGKPWQAELGRLFAALGGGLSDRLQNQPPLWTHNDWHPSNLLWSPDGAVQTVFDFGLAAQTCAIHDLATAIERTAIPWLQLDEPADAQAALAFLAGYRTVLSLSRADIEAIIHLLPLVHIEFALSEIDYFAGILADPDQAMLAWEIFLIGHAEWFLSPPGQGFLQQLDCRANG